MSAFEELMTYQRQSEALAQIAGRLGWDQETVMPKGAAEQRGEEHAAIQTVLHQRRTDPRVGDWLEQAEASDEAGQAQLREIRRGYDRANKVPARLAAELARTTSLAHGIWAQARANEDFAQFAPELKKVIVLRQEEADAISDGGDRYDALLQDYEPGATGVEIAAMFDEMRPRLVALRDRIQGSKVQVDALDREFQEQAQLTLSRELALGFGYDLDHGRIDKAVHPFSSGSGLDVRITTRTSLRDPFNCFYSTIHEVGHAAYEQGVDPSYLLTPIGQGASMGVHESQSRIYENQLGRSRAYCAHLFSRMQDLFGDFGIATPEAFYATVNRVHPGYIRTESDEVQYNLHILMRFDIERQLLSGDLAVEDLPEAWNARFEADFGIAVDKPSNGCLQDVHWSEGLFGYFPTYSLGNVYAGCLHRALRADVPDLDTDLRQGETGAATAWLRNKVQQYGALRLPRDTIAHATAEVPSVTPLLDYLDQKFGEIYNL